MKRPVANLPTRFGTFRVTAFSDDVVVLCKGEVEGKENVLVRIHSECFTGDTLNSLRCDCREQLEKAMGLIEESGEGLIIYLRAQEGRGIGLFNKIKTYELQENGYDTVEANHQIGFADDLRTYGQAAGVLGELGVKSIRLITNNPDKVEQLREKGIDVSERVPVSIVPNQHNEKYLKTKKEKMNHLL